MTEPPSASSNSSLALSPGDRLGHYEIVSLLGAGGMGEVYRAHDPRLARDVALKVLRRPSADAARLARFSREARAVGSLNHPNILAVFDVGTEAGVPYVVTELLEGETLRARLDRAPLSFRKAVDYGIHIAQALDAAHAKKIWHRDVKPANAFITNDGRVKLLDFGIAKLSERSLQAESEETTAELSHAYEVLGTAGYMSPEQVLGHPLDHRSDIFALGAVLYEMFTRARAFKRASTVQTMTAVLQEDPIDPLTLNAGLPPMAAAIVRRCLEKDKEERFQSARDLAFDLQQLRDVTAGARPLSAESATYRRRGSRAVVAGSVLLAAAALTALWLLRRPADPPTFEQLSFRRARIGAARFVADGPTVVYSEAREGHAWELWRGDLNRPLDYPPGTNILAARAGELALLMRPRFLVGERFVGTLAFAPIGGGTPHEVRENVEDADWDSAGRLAVARSTGAVGGGSWLEYPIDKTLYEPAGSIRFPRVSRDGQRIAFLEDPNGLGAGGHVAVLELSGGRTVTKLTDEWASVRGLAWSADGKELWFTAGRSLSSRALRAVNLQGRQRTVLNVPGSLTLWDITSEGHVLLTRDDERRFTVGKPPGQSAERELSYFDDSGVADLSDDGRQLLFSDRFGVYLRSTDGTTPPADLGLKDAYADDLSPDGTKVLATRRQGPQLVIVPIRSGSQQPLPAHGIVKYNGALWLPDGQRVVFNGQEAGRINSRSYIQDVNGGAPRPLTPENVLAVSISRKGDWAAAIETGRGISLWPIAGGRPQIVPGSHEGDRPVAWSADDRSLWIFRRGEIPAHVDELDITSGRRKPWKTLVPADGAGVYSISRFAITPDGNAYFYSYSQQLSQLYLVRGLR